MGGNTCKWVGAPLALMHWWPCIWGCVGGGGGGCLRLPGPLETDIFFPSFGGRVKFWLEGRRTSG